MSSEPLFSPPCGPVSGWRDGDVLRATGIPYATAGRFQPPASATDWTTAFAATSPAPACPQGPVPFLDDIPFLTRLIRDRQGYRKLRADHVRKLRPAGYGIADIWNGDGHNPNALLTI